MRSKKVDEVERNKCIEIFKGKVNRYDESVEIKGVSVGEEMRILDTVVDYIEELEKDNIKWKGKYHLLSRKIDITPNQVIRDKIEEYKKIIKQCINDEEHYHEIPLYEHDIEVLKELLEEEK